MMGDYISRDAALIVLDWDCASRDALNAIKAIPAADVVEVVRCRECIYNCGETKDLCGNPAILCVTAMTHKPDWYCAGGERKDGGQDEEVKWVDD